VNKHSCDDGIITGTKWTSNMAVVINYLFLGLKAIFLYFICGHKDCGHKDVCTTPVILHHCKLFGQLIEFRIKRILHVLLEKTATCIFWILHNPSTSVSIMAARFVVYLFLAARPFSPNPAPLSAFHLPSIDLSVLCDSFPL